MQFTRQTSMKDINEADFFIQARGHFIGGGEAFFTGEAGTLTLEQLWQKQPTWYPEDIIYGLEHLRNVAELNETYVWTVYSEAEIAENHALAEVKLFHLPGGWKKPYVILLAGGAYGAVCSMVESIPAAARLNEMGFSVFCLNYRTVKQETFTKGLLPEPLDDLAAAYRFIRQNAQQFNIEPEDYIVGGFSAGGHVASLWGTQHLGYRKYLLPPPRMLMLIYPLISVEAITGDIAAYMLTGMLGTGYTSEQIDKYSVNKHIDPKYPPVYLLQSMDDSTVGTEGAQSVIKALRQYKIPVKAEFPLTGGHGYGIGSATEACGWIERAIEFARKLELLSDTKAD